MENKICKLLAGPGWKAFLQGSASTAFAVLLPSPYLQEGTRSTAAGVLARGACTTALGQAAPDCFPRLHPALQQPFLTVTTAEARKDLLQPQGPGEK